VSFYGNTTYNPYIFKRAGKSIDALGIRWLTTFMRFLCFLKKNRIKLGGHIGVFQTENEAVLHAKDNYDILCCGSDAIWRHSHIRRFFFWDYPTELGTIPHFAYAPSIQSRELNYNPTDAFKSFVGISTRETKGKDILSAFTDKTVKVVLDPVLTVDESKWHAVAAKRIINESYIVCYFIDNPDRNFISVEDLQKKYGVSRVVFINTDVVDKGYRSVYTSYHGYAVNKVIGPAEFLSLIKYADAVCTDSFHGTCFSIAFRKDFYVFTRGGRDFTHNADYRLQDIMDRLDIGSRIVKDNRQMSEMHEIDYGIVEKALISERKDQMSI
jgi:hypothetical protein